MARDITYGEILAKVQKDLDLEDEDFVILPELMGYCNQAMRNLESMIMKTHQDYFLQSWPLTWVSGQSDYDLPENLFVDKIRRIIYKKGVRVYTVNKLKKSYKFEWMAQSNISPTAEQYRMYDIINDATTGRKLRFFPTPQESGDLLTLWGIRNIKEITSTDDVIEFDEFRSYIEVFMKKCVLEKEGAPLLGTMEQNLQVEERRVLESFSERVPDDDTILEADFSHYEEHC